MSDALLDVATIPEALSRAARTDAGITLIDRDLDGRTLPYAELADEAARAAAHLDRLGAGPGDRVCLLAPTDPDLLVALFGAWWAGCIPVVLPLPRRQSELDAYIDDMARRVKATDARVLVLSELFAPYAPELDSLPARPVTLPDLVSRRPPPVSPPPMSPDDLAYLQFTSGTTAASRAVALSHRNLVTNIGAAGSMLGLDPDRDVIVSWLPLFHDMGLIGTLFGAVLYGAPLVLEPTEEFLARPGSWIDAISRHGGTITAAPNFGYGLAARDLRSNPRELDLSRWRVAANGAEPVDVDTVSRFTETAGAYGFRPEAMCPMYGLAEATLAVTLSSPDEPLHTERVSREALETENRVVPAPDGVDARTLVACGRPVATSEVAVLDEAGEPVPDGHIGEICVGGPSIMMGYWRDPETTGDSMHDGLLRTGDLGYVGPHGLVVTGRAKDMIVLGGRNLYPEDYEACAEEVAGVRRGNVIAFALHERERMVVVAETTVDAAEADGVARSTLERLRRRLPRGPEEVVLVSPGTLPKTSSGKRQRGRCRQRYAAGELEPLAAARRV